MEIALNEIFINVLRYVTHEGERVVTRAMTDYVVVDRNVYNRNIVGCESHERGGWRYV